MKEPTLQDAKDLIERMKTARPNCAFCATEPYDWFMRRTEESRARMREVGWEESSHTAMVFLRCYSCRDGRTFPWAEKLDLERVLAHMKTKTSAWALSELEALL